MKENRFSVCWNITFWQLLINSMMRNAEPCGAWSQNFPPSIAEAVHGLKLFGMKMEFPESLPMKIREVWENNLARMRANGVAADPNEFAMAFVDQNFPEAAA
jgi:hypothetical protein